MTTAAPLDPVPSQACKRNVDMVLHQEGDNPKTSFLVGESHWLVLCLETHLEMSLLAMEQAGSPSARAPVLVENNEGFAATDAAGRWAPAARRSGVLPGNAWEGKLQNQRWTWPSSLVKDTENKLRENRRWKVAFRVEIVSFRVNLALAGLSTGRSWCLSAVLDGVRSRLCASDGGGTPCPRAAPLCSTLARLQHPARVENHLRPVSNWLGQGFVIRGAVKGDLKIPSPLSQVVLSCRATSTRLRPGEGVTHVPAPRQPMLEAKQPQFPQPLLIRLLLQTLHQLRCPSLDTLQHQNVPLVVGGPKLNTVFEVRPHQCRVQGHNHFPSPTGHAIFDISQDAIGFLGHLGTLLAHIQAAVNQHPQVLFCLAAFQPLFPKPVALHGVAVAQVQDLALGLVKPHTIDLGPLIQPVQVPLQSLPPLKQINTPAQLGVICKLTEGALNPFVQIID
ncbi:hypothetical protein QYF61_001232 [Mycteria americana]|uniref:Uncharacterized protein n=1 Tax=Mycteria americana TaxID=33587 RepID=A0AAN7NP73_MYCAM|nr:hypothetical protein QYF61_001232 [Mycteria americana]